MVFLLYLYFALNLLLLNVLKCYASYVKFIFEEGKGIVHSVE